LETINPIGIAVPFFFILMLAEYIYSRKTGRSLYRLNDAIAALTCGMGDQLVDLITSVFTVAIYHYVATEMGMFDWDSSSAATWVAAMFLVDFFYYCYHRFSHRVNFAWATHVVHHQSEEYNLAVALRQSWFAKSFSWAFYIPLALLGLPTVVWAGSYAANLLYQYWIHTQSIGRLGPLEWVMNTPSHHRVHHGTNPQYIDKNYAGIFIIWDRLLGTFEREDETVLYGIMKPSRTWNPLMANVMPIVNLARDSASQDKWTDKFKMWFAEPGWTPSGVQLPPFPAPNRGYNANAVPNLGAYIVTHLLPVGTATAYVIAYSKLWPASWLGLGAAYIFWTGMNWAGLLEGEAWARPSEWIRLVVVGFGAAFWATTGAGLAFGAALVLCGLSVVSLPWFRMRSTSEMAA